MNVFTWKTIRFEDLKDNDIFYCFGDLNINYDYPAWCECIKLSSCKAQEVDGVSFFICPDDLVSVIDNTRSIITVTTDMYKKYNHLSTEEAYEAIIRDNRDNKIKEIIND